MALDNGADYAVLRKYRCHGGGGRRAAPVENQPIGTGVDPTGLDGDLVVAGLSGELEIQLDYVLHDFTCFPRGLPRPQRGQLQIRSYSGVNGRRPGISVGGVRIGCRWGSQSEANGGYAL